MPALGQTYTSPQGAQAQLQQTTARKYATTVGAPPQGAQPQADQTQQPAPQPTSLQGPSPYYQQQPVGPDVQALGDIRAQMIDELFNHDQALSQKYSPQTMAQINPLQLQGIETQRLNSRLGMLGTLNQLLSAAQPKKLSPAEQKQAYQDQLATDLQNNPNVPLSEVVKAYRPYMSTNDIIDAVNAANPSGVNLKEAQAYGYKPPTDIVKAQSAYDNATLALKAIQDLDTASKNAQRWYGLAYAIPGLRNLFGSQDPSANYQQQKLATAQELTKLLYGSNYPGVAKNIQDLIPDVYSSEGVRQSNIDSLKKEAMNRMDAAQETAGTFALSSNPMQDYAYAQGNQPAQTQQLMAPQGPSYTTSSGNTYSIVPSGL